MSASELRDKVAFDKRTTTDDGYGNVDGAWQEQFLEPARIRPLRGGEGVQAARLSGTQPVIITVRSSARTRQVTSSWRIRDARTGDIYAITAPPANTDEHDAYLDIMAVIGEAA
jgi:head-tail adaptor